MIIDRIELKQIGIPHDMQRSMAGEAEAKVQSKAKMIMSMMESEANNKLVEAGDSLDPVSVHLRYLQTMMRINQPQNDNHGFIVPMPLEMLRLKQSFLDNGRYLISQLIKSINRSIIETKEIEKSDKTKIRRKRVRKIKRD